MEILHLVLIGKWYGMIDRGEKTEEYRALTPYWCNRLIQKYGINYWNETFKNNSIERLSRIWGDGKPEIFGFNGIRGYDAVCFHRGYTNTTMSFEYKYLTIGKGNKEWGAPEDNVFIIKLGDRL